MKNISFIIFLNLLIPIYVQAAATSAIESTPELGNTYIFYHAPGEESLRLVVTQEAKKASFQIMLDGNEVRSKLTLDNNTLLLENPEDCEGIESLIIHNIPNQATLLSLMCSGKYPIRVKQKAKKHAIVLNKYPMRYLFYTPVGAKTMQRLIKDTQGMPSLAVVLDYLQRRDFMASVAVIDLEAILLAFHGKNWKDEFPWKSAPYVEGGTVKLDICKRDERRGKHYDDVHGFLEKLHQDEKRKHCTIQ